MTIRAMTLKGLHRPAGNRVTQVLLLCVASLSVWILPLGQSMYVNAQTIEVTLADGQISPRQFSTPVNQSVSLHVVNKGSKIHNFVIPDFFVFTQNLNPGKDVSVRFTPSKTGAFPYYSDKNGKPEAGMEGTIHVGA